MSQGQTSLSQEEKNPGLRLTARMWLSLEAVLHPRLAVLPRAICQDSPSSGGQRSQGEKEPDIAIPSDLLPPGKSASDT